MRAIVTTLVLATAMYSGLSLGQSLGRDRGDTIVREKEPLVPGAAQMLLSSEQAVREKARDEILAAHRQLVAELCSNVADHANHRSSAHGVAESIRMLGELRSREAIDVLVEHIGFPLVRYPDGTSISPFPFRPGQPLGDSLPAIGALIKIGPASVLPAARKLVATKSDVEYEACFDVLYSLRGGMMPVTVEEAMDWAYRTASPERRLRLSSTRRSLGMPPVPEGFPVPPILDEQ